MMTRTKSRYLVAWTLAVLAIFSQNPLAAELFVVTPFSTIDPAVGIPASWEPLTFPKIERLTEYRPKSVDGRTVIEARSRDSASGLVHKLDIDPRQSPWLCWQWWIENAIEGSNVAVKAGDDCAARIYVAFEFDDRRKSWWESFKHRTKRMFAGQEIPGSAIVYAWTNGNKVGSIIDSPYTKQSKLIVVQSGNDLKKRWVSEKRNIVDDYFEAYGVLPPPIMGIAIMTDTDNTGGETTAYYGDIRFACGTSISGNK